MVNPDQEAKYFDPAFMLDEVIDHHHPEIVEQERRHDIEKPIRDAAAVMVDLQDKGPLYDYVLARREDAKQAMSKLITIDPADTAGIASAQAAVKEYVAACDWINDRLTRGAEAEQTIEQEYGDGTTQPED